MHDITYSQFAQQSNVTLLQVEQPEKGEAQQTDCSSRHATPVATYWGKLQEGFDEGIPFTISVDGAAFQVERRLEDLEAVMLQNKATSCIVLGPVRNLHQNTSPCHVGDRLN